ncbi:Phosphoinositide 3-kinase regulatory subunit 6 [Liparis tanakae]|uniref:Phosphoinositide 3-kinase regulatory subunit 6 n=1 Tax=Liparis tanakae TaxID=230148 RepID=A0A4Z2EMP5_9TELE|nr:Phosphoinositide 3-kinase regulatory subunit 6 [Liparis tanakae]
MIPKLAKMQQMDPGKPKEPFVPDVISYYVRTGQQPVYFTIYFVKITFTNQTKDPVEDVFLTHLEMELPDLRRISSSLRDKQKKSSGEVCGPVVSLNYRKDSRIRSNNIKMRTLESRPFTVTLDRDCRRSYTDVQSIEISPCLDPRYCVQKTIRSKFKLGEDKDAGLSKYMNKGLSLPINTFAGIIS